MIIAFAKLGNNKRVWELLDMINPVNHGKTADAIATYKVEPYVLAADVYAMAPHAGRGGWTWYTGSAGWMYRLIIESFLGIQRKADQLKFAPCVPPDWESFKVHYRYKKTLYHIVFTQKNGAGEMIVTLDGTEEKGGIVALADDGLDHEIKIAFFTERL
jgi:cyclic beta-1,2-glucan synthetase